MILFRCCDASRVVLSLFYLPLCPYRPGIAHRNYDDPTVHLCKAIAVAVSLYNLNAGKSFSPGKSDSNLIRFSYICRHILTLIF